MRSEDLKIFADKGKINMSTDMIKVQALTQQGKNKVFSFFINGPDIFKIADMYLVLLGDEKGNLKGLQLENQFKNISRA